ncbi:MAG TPA: 50S ribosomal protein L21 [Candidatus Dormibacteraeota bacterium]|jgi:large subunit ribosomal protein L21|nr:50S ribosomal protein L21 [Candidatus Dormibacteraeota bacterium]
MYAILQQSGHQYRVSPGDRLVVDRLTAEVGAMVALEPVVLVAGDGGTQVGTPVVDGARVAAVVVSHGKGAKIRVFKYKPKKRYRRTQGHRSLLTELRVEAVLAAGEPLPEPKVVAAKVDEAPAKPARSRKPKATAEPADETGATTGAAEPGDITGAAATTAAAEAPTADAAPDAPEAPAAAAPEVPKKTPRPRAKKPESTPAADSGETPES